MNASFPNLPDHRRGERGNVMMYIFIAVILLAALTYAVAQSTRGNVQQLSADRARMVGAEIIEYSNIMANAVAQLRLRGVEATDLCFDDTGWGGGAYNHGGCTDTANRIFHSGGGGLNWGRPPEIAMAATPVPDNLWHIYGDNEIDDVGTTCGTAACAELILLVDELGEQTCIQINELLGITNPGGVPPTDTNIGETPFAGTFGYSQTIGDEAGGTDFQGRTSACFQRTAAPAEYTFYKVLIAR